MDKKMPDGAQNKNQTQNTNQRGPMGGPPRMQMVREKPKNAKKTIVKLLKYIGANRYLVILLLLITIAAAFLTLAGPYLQGIAIDTITITDSKLSIDFNSLLKTLAMMGGVYILSALLTFIQGLISAQISQNTVHTMRNDLFKKISYLPIRYTDTHQHGDIMSRMTNDVDNVSNTISTSISSLFSSVITLVGALAMMIFIKWQMALVAMITIPLTLFVSLFLSKFMRKYFVERQRILGNLNGQIEEMVSGYKTVMAYGKEKKACTEFSKASDEFRKCSIKANVWGGIMGPCMNVINNLNYLIVAAFGGYMCFNGAISVGNIQSILQYSRQFAQPINQIANQYAQILTAIAGAERVFAILDSEDEIDEGKDAMPADEVKGNIEFNHIYFSYNEGEPVLKDFNLKVKQGQKIAIVGATGSGKTTVVNLLTRFYEIDSGEILLDGKNITEIPKKDLRSAIGIVLQDTVLFSDTIETNIKYGNLNATEAEVKAAAATANADIFIDRLPEGYKTQLAESGGNLSQGQRQLLSITRAVLADPKILILDEATSSVDTRTEMHIQQAMVALMKNRTSLIIAHRLSTIRDADVIVVIKNGTVAETGNHDELIEAKGEYYKLYQNQFAGFAT